MKDVDIPIQKRSPFLRIGALLLLLSLLLSLVSCGGEPVIVTEGLVILDAPSRPVSEESIERATGVLYAVFLHAAEKRVSNIPSGTKKKIEGHAAAVAARLAAVAATDEICQTVTTILEKYGALAVDEYFEGSSKGYPRLRSLYLALSGYLSVEGLSSLGYEILLYSYDYRLDALWKRYEAYGYPHLQEEHAALTEERALFVSEVGRDSFSAVMRTLLMLMDLFTEAEGDTDKLTSFTPAELLIFLRYIPLDELCMNAKGYEILLSHAADRTGGDLPMLIAVALDAGDLPAIAEKMDGFITLFIHLRNAMGKEEALLLQEKRLDALLSALFEKLPEEDWEFLASLSRLPLDREAYDTAAKKRFGEAYVAYRDALAPITAEELRAAVGEDSFKSCLLRYLASVTPALSYLFEKQ